MITVKVVRASDNKTTQSFSGLSEKQSYIILKALNDKFGNNKFTVIRERECCRHRHSPQIKDII